MRFLREFRTGGPVKRKSFTAGKNRGSVARLTLATLRGATLPPPTCTEIYGNSLFASFKGSRVLSYTAAPLYCSASSASKPTSPSLPSSHPSTSSPRPYSTARAYAPRRSLPPLLDTSIFVQVSTSGYRCNAGTNATEHLSPYNYFGERERDRASLRDFNYIKFD